MNKQSPQRPAHEMVFFLDACSYRPEQLQCLHALNHIGKVAGDAVRVSLGTTYQGYREKTTLSDPTLTKHGQYNGAEGDFARFVREHQDMVHFFKTDISRHVMDVLKDRNDYTKGAIPEVVIPFIREMVATYEGAVEKGLERGEEYQDWSVGGLMDTVATLKRNAFAVMQYAGYEKLPEGIIVSEQLEIDTILTFLQEERPSLSLQIIRGTGAVYNNTLRDHEEFKKARADAGEKSVFELVRRGFYPGTRKEFGEDILIVYVSDDKGSWSQAQKLQETGAAKMPVHMLNTKGFEDMLSGIVKALRNQIALPDYPDLVAAVNVFDQSISDLHAAGKKPQNPVPKNQLFSTASHHDYHESSFARKVVEARKAREADEPSL